MNQLNFFFVIIDTKLSYGHQKRTNIGQIILNSEIDFIRASHMVLFTVKAFPFWISQKTKQGFKKLFYYIYYLYLSPSPSALFHL